MSSHGFGHNVADTRETRFRGQNLFLGARDQISVDGQGIEDDPAGSSGVREGPNAINPRTSSLVSGFNIRPMPPYEIMGIDIHSATNRQDVGSLEGGGLGVVISGRTGPG